MPITARVAISGAQNFQPSGQRKMATRSTPKAPIFMSTPAWTMLTPVGAATWPTGDQVWNGQTAARMPKPRNSSRKASFCWNTEKVPGCMRAVMSKLVPPAATCR